MIYENTVVNGVECRAQVQRSQKWDPVGISAESQIIDYFGENSFCAMVSSEAWLELFQNVVFIKHRKICWPLFQVPYFKMGGLIWTRSYLGLQSPNVITSGFTTAFFKASGKTQALKSSIVIFKGAIENL